MIGALHPFLFRMPDVPCLHQFILQKAASDKKKCVTSYYQKYYIHAITFSQHSVFLAVQYMAFLWNDTFATYYKSLLLFPYFVLLNSTEDYVYNEMDRLRKVPPVAW